MLDIEYFINYLKNNNIDIKEFYVFKLKQITYLISLNENDLNNIMKEYNKDNKNILLNKINQEMNNNNFNFDFSIDNNIIRLNNILVDFFDFNFNTNLEDKDIIDLYKHYFYYMTIKKILKKNR